MYGKHDLNHINNNPHESRRQRMDYILALRGTHAGIIFYTVVDRRNASVVTDLEVPEALVKAGYSWIPADAAMSELRGNNGIVFDTR